MLLKNPTAPPTLRSAAFGTLAACCRMPGHTVMLSKRDCITRKAAGIVNLCSFFVVFTATVALATADVPQSSCQALPPDALLFEEMPSPSCLRGAFQGVTLHNRSAGNVASMDDEVVDIQLPFPFRWFGTLYDTVSVGSNSYVTFGGSKMIFDFSLGVFDPPFPSMFIDASDNSMQLLTAGLVPQGWLVHYEGRYDIPPILMRSIPATLFISAAPPWSGSFCFSAPAVCNYALVSEIRLIPPKLSSAPSAIKSRQFSPRNSLLKQTISTNSRPRVQKSTAPLSPLLSRKSPARGSTSCCF